MNYGGGNLYLIPASLGGDDITSIWPSANVALVNQLDEFIVENVRTARRFLRSAGFSRPFEDVPFHLLNKHTKPIEISGYLNAALKGKSIGLLSEAGCPCIADPGQAIVAIAHQKNIRVIPLVGPSSILLALMASGFNGQNFAFNGYLPIQKPERTSKLKNLEQKAWNEGQTQIFMETPFRNNQLMDHMVSTLRRDTLLCVACDLTLPVEFIKTQPIGFWKKEMPDLHKRTSIFLLYHS
ncbi:MAG: SAM-dependent methyltransferase [Bacteroides sp.]|jgi:16S rRNA (cytidine1402-2'-O)-methyltransferase|nr:SAM-dependent methyltransferase [Bacteroides sp.]